jgi:hypothetical protein
MKLLNTKAKKEEEVKHLRVYINGVEIKLIPDLSTRQYAISEYPVTISTTGSTSGIYTIYGVEED